MKSIRQWAHHFAGFLSLAFLSTSAFAQATPAIQGTSVADPAIPVLVAPVAGSSGFFVLNQDFSLLQHSTADTSQNQSCAGPSIYSRTNPAQRTLVSDLYNAYISGPDGSGANAAIDAVTPEVLCNTVTPFDYTGGLPVQSLASNDIHHALYYLLSGYGGGVIDTLTVLDNLNSATVSSNNKFTEESELALDIGGQYTSMVSDVRSDFGLTAITELRTATSPGNLWVYDPQSKLAYKILGPGGVPLPAVTSFIIPPQTDGGGSLLLLVNQDGLTASNLNSPPLDTAPFTIIDLGQLRPLFATNPANDTITLPFVMQIKAATSFYAMLGAAYNPLDHRVYAAVAGGTSEADVTEDILSYDTLNPQAPNETVVADISNVPFSLGAYPQLALNAASKTMQILTSDPAAVYTVGISGTKNTAVAVPGSTFPDTNFLPTYIAANPLMGETYITSASGQVDILTRPARTQGGLTITLTGSDLGYTSQEYQVTPLALWPVYDASLATAKLTITVTPKGGKSVVLATGHVADIGYPGTSFYTYMFPAAGQYTIVATAEASANYPAVTSPPLNVFVGNTGVYPTAVSLSIPATISATNGEASLNATVTLTGTTYGPSGQVYIQDPSGAEVGNVQLPNGVISNPITVPIIINQGVQTLTAVYSGDEQNQSSKSTSQTITVGTVAKVTPSFTLTLPSTVVSGASVTGNLKVTSILATAPTGTITIYAAAAGSQTANQIATVSATQAFAAAGMNFTFTAPAKGSYSVFAGYGGDTNYNNLISTKLAITVTSAALQTTAIGIVAPATATPGTAFNTVVGFNVEGAFSTQPTGNIILTATLAGGAAKTVGTVTPAQGMAPGGANVSVTLPSAGVYTLNASYAGDSLYASSSNTATVTVKGIATTIKVTTATNETAGTAFAATIALTDNGSTLAPTGNVILTANPSSGAPITLATITAAQALASGGAQVKVTIPSAGSYTLMATYAGDATFSSSSGSAAVTVAAPPIDPTTIGISGPSKAQATATFVVTAALRETNTSTASITGNVTITATSTGSNSNSYVLGTMTAVQALVTGGAQLSVSIPTKGSYTVTAVYPGDANFGKSSGSVVVSVGPPPPVATKITLSGAPDHAIQTGSAFSLTVGITSATTPTAAITGKIVLTADSTPSLGKPLIQLGTVSAAAAYSVGGTSKLVTLPTGSNGSYQITATYPGDSSYAASSTYTAVNVVGGNSSLTLTGPTTAVTGAPTQFALKLGNVLYEAEGGGNVTLSSTLNGTAGPTATTDYSTAVEGTTIPLVFPNAGTYTVVASFAGDVANPATTSAPITVVATAATKPSLSMVLNSPTSGYQLNLYSSSQSVTTPMTLTAAGGFNTPVMLTLVPANRSKIQFSFEDASGKTITSLTPATTGSVVTIRASGSDYVKPSAVPASRKKLSVYFAGGILVLLLSGFRKRSEKVRRCLTFLGVLMVAGLLGSFVGGCARPDAQMTVTVTATPTSTTQGVTAQTIQFQVGYVGSLAE